MDINLSRHSMKSYLIRLTFLLLVVIGAGLHATPGRADPVSLVECIGTHQANWSPGLTNTEHLVNVSTTSNWNCLLPVGASASSVQEFQATFSCQSLFLQTQPITWTIKWNDGVTSTYEFMAQVNNILNLETFIISNGKITNGRYKNASARTVFELKNLKSILNNDCNQPTGVTQVSGVAKLVITP
ncbi:hypothetical protein ALQ04_00260 [Pseudomonas cichorii]|uniref:Uncharacterized protein n=1 Tax=Pseudomonas cichorii TaxID=36746 RepID=A0A3M4M6B8_PSECI|nr:hypothetical protein [Pseudomonas cichorii]RMQ49240.1 hypothetical protein ALQ04_00260 [Pseudomonas cichorii]